MLKKLWLNNRKYSMKCTIELLTINYYHYYCAVDDENNCRIKHNKVLCCVTTANYIWHFLFLSENINN